MLRFENFPDTTVEYMGELMDYADLIGPDWKVRLAVQWRQAWDDPTVFPDLEQSHGAVWLALWEIPHAPTPEWSKRYNVIDTCTGQLVCPLFFDGDDPMLREILADFPWWGILPCEERLW